ncbi:hypothetical protein H072_175 [Dactylellina haptotyla CBS 200.50]|uniref:Transcription factor Iwr1 domain-containing protein n=1 Tax=Dactylellina haptotyla (strain CBS 200.50) TaxID=1284197 RepID=S8ASC5_DACHA|nr:hypothetical protein H072_175 [Dactylellina haptotyla CBS 200.50]
MSQKISPSTSASNRSQRLRNRLHQLFLHVIPFATHQEELTFLIPPPSPVPSSIIVQPALSRTGSDYRFNEEELALQPSGLCTPDNTPAAPAAYIDGAVIPSSTRGGRGTDERLYDAYDILGLNQYSGGSGSTTNSAEEEGEWNSRGEEYTGYTPAEERACRPQHLNGRHAHLHFGDTYPTAGSLLPSREDEEDDACSYMGGYHDDVENTREREYRQQREWERVQYDTFLLFQQAEGGADGYGYEDTDGDETMAESCVGDLPSPYYRDIDLDDMDRDDDDDLESDEESGGSSDGYLSSTAFGDASGSNSGSSSSSSSYPSSGYFSSTDEEGGGQGMGVLVDDVMEEEEEEEEEDLYTVMPPVETRC